MSAETREALLQPEPLDDLGATVAAGPRVAVLVPCLNEEATVRRVVTDFLRALPTARVYVYDNGSTDRTAEVAVEAGATLRRESRPGKGNVVRRMFADVEADVYVLVDGDDTYEASAAAGMVELLLAEGLDMVVGRRLTEATEVEAYRRGHVLGNLLFSRVLRMVFGGAFSDVFSGYRVMSRRLVKTFPVTSRGFELETELAAHALDLAAPCAEVDTRYRARPADSSSKLRTYRDGSRIALAAVRLYRLQYPARFFGVLAILMTVVALALGLPVVAEFVDTGEVPRFPTAFLAAAVQTVAVVFLAAGIILDSVTKVRREVKQLHYLGKAHWQPDDGRGGRGARTSD